MIRVREFACACGNRFEVFTKERLCSAGCPKCGSEAYVVMSAPRARLEGTTGAFPGAAMAWERKRAQHMALERRREREHGDSGWR